MTCSQTAEFPSSGTGSFRKRRWAGCALLLFAACSSASGAEVGATSCTDERDNDGDQLSDCDDPDCYALEACRLLASVLRDASTPTKRDAGAREIPSRTDAGVIANSVPDATVDVVENLPTFVDAGAFVCSPCLPTEECVEGQCQIVAVDQTAHYALRILSAVVPDLDATTRCYDPGLSCAGALPSPPYGLCTCPTDPFVRVVLARGDTKALIGMTATVMDDSTPTFPSTEIDLLLEPGDVLIFEVWDADTTPKKDEFLYECKPDLSTLMAGPISCTALGGALNAQLLSVKGELLDL